MAVLAPQVRGGQGHRRAAAHVRVRAEEGVPRLPRHRRRAARRRAHLRHVGVPARTRTARQPLDTEFAGTTYESILWQAACHYRAQQIGPKSKQLMELTGAKVHHGRAVLGHRRHLGAAGREHGDGEAGGQAADGEGPRVGRPTSSPATATSRTPRSRKPPTRCRRTRSRCWPARTGSSERSEEADRRRHRRPSRLRAGARRVPRRTSSTMKTPPAHRGRRSRHHRVREHRHDALPGPGDGARRADAHRRRDRRRGRRPTTSSSRTTASSRARSSSSSPTTPSSASGSRSSSASSTRCASTSPTVRTSTRFPKTRSASVARTSPRPSTTLKFPFSPAQRGHFTAGSARIVIDHPDYHTVADLTDERDRAELARDFAVARAGSCDAARFRAPASPSAARGGAG